MIRESYIDTFIGRQIKAENEAKQAEHISSGRLSASMLGQPLQWQILHHYGIKGRAIDEYTLRKFVRGEEVEEWFLNRLPFVTDRQVKVEYRGCIGYIDAMMDTADHDWKLGIIPHEIKSVANSKFKRIMEERRPDRGHKLQAGYYALGTGAKHFAVDYIAADDLRILTFIFETKEVEAEINAIIDKYDAQVAKGTIPVFEAVEAWHANKLYNSYDAYMKLAEEISPDLIVKA